MIVHMVLLKVKKSVSAAKVKQVMESIGALDKAVPGIVAFSWGPYSSPEGLNKGFTHGFCSKFKDAKSRNTYLDHPEHGKVKLAVLSILDGGLDAVVAFDYAE